MVVISQSATKVKKYRTTLDLSFCQLFLYTADVYSCKSSTDVFNLNLSLNRFLAFFVSYPLSLSFSLSDCVYFYNPSSFELTEDDFYELIVPARAVSAPVWIGGGGGGGGVYFDCAFLLSLINTLGVDCSFV